MLLLAFILVLVGTNGLYISPWCWVLLGVQVALELFQAVTKSVLDK